MGLKKRKQTLWQWLTTNFIVNIRNEENFALKRDFTINYAQILALIVFGFMVSAIVNFYVFKVINDYYSGERKLEARYEKKIIGMVLRLDSIETEIARRDTFIADLKEIISGKSIQKLNMNHTSQMESGIKPLVQNSPPTDQEIRLREEFERTQITNNYIRINKALADLSFFPPVSGGLITSEFNVHIHHLGVDIVAKPNEPVKSVLDGTVIFSGWTKEAGNTVYIQHSRDLISAYKHNTSLLKKIGNQVKAGEVIAIVGNSGEWSTGPHLHFEIWYKGKALNPKDYIVF